MSFITLFTAGLAAMAPLVAAYTPPKGDPTGNAIFTPGSGSIVPVGKPYEITWDPTTEGKVALVLLHGPSTNVVPIFTIADSTDNTGKYSWTPSSLLAPNTTYYGLQIIVEGTGQYQYSTQFGISNPYYKPDYTGNIKLPLTSEAAGVVASASGLIMSGSSVVSSVLSEASGKVSDASSMISDAAVSASGVVSSAVASASGKVSSAASAASGSASSALASATGSMSTGTKTATRSSASGSSTRSASASLASSTGAAGKVGAGLGSLALAAGVAAFVF